MPPRTSSRGTVRKVSAPKTAPKPTNIVFADATPAPEDSDVLETRPSKRPMLAEPESTPAAASPFASSSSPSMLLDLKRVMASHEAVISVLAIVVACCTLAAVLVGYLHTVQISGLSMDAKTTHESQINVQRNLANVQAQVKAIDQRVTDLEAKAASSTAPAPVQTTSSTSSVINSLPVAANRVTEPMTSPSGKLVRGSLSPDGTKFAGFDVVTVGKRGVAVEVIGETTVHHLVIFNPATQSSGLGLPEEPTMSVRWKDNSTLEYDIILKNADGTKTRKVQTVSVNL